jgi:hypothetical protein
MKRRRDHEQGCRRFSRSPDEVGLGDVPEGSLSGGGNHELNKLAQEKVRSPFLLSATGDVVGFYGNPPAERGFLLSRGTFEEIDFPDATSTGAFGINARGDIVGLSFSAGGGHGFLANRNGRRTYEYTEIRIPGSTRTQLQGINARGEIVGWHVSGGVTHGLLLRKRASNTGS